MKKVIEFTPSEINHIEKQSYSERSDIRECPSCGMMSIKGMPGGADSTCKNCGYKDPCCYDY
jgi:hypothetical protein